MNTGWLEGSNPSYNSQKPGILFFIKFGAATGAYDIRPENESGKVRLFCQMNAIPGCGTGGWTLVMKIDGSKTTFTYNSSIWTTKTPFKPENGYDVTETETKLPSYWLTSMTKLCLGMKYGGMTNWISLNYTAKSLYDVIKDGANRRTNVDPEIWKSLIVNSKIEVLSVATPRSLAKTSFKTGCNWEGFNAKTVHAIAAQARIGIVGARNCDIPSVSRIGFGTSGSHFGMKDNNSCGNEYQGDNSIMAFGYILVQ
ncbi:hypothetical protein QZH41_011639 [Actinostola sp. cb2023]|nr:hypothetical protein QZH41_011639 [Actinostola sp. cb2023]